MAPLTSGESRSDIMSSLPGYYNKQPIKADPGFVRLSGQLMDVSGLQVGREIPSKPQKAAGGGGISSPAACISNQVAS